MRAKLNMVFIGNHCMARSYEARVVAARLLGRTYPRYFSYVPSAFCPYSDRPTPLDRTDLIGVHYTEEHLPASRVSLGQAVLNVKVFREEVLLGDGSSVLVSPNGDLVSAYHVFSDGSEKGDERQRLLGMKINLSNDLALRIGADNIIVVDRESDFVHLRFDELKENPFVPVVDQPPKAGDIVWLIGYPQAAISRHQGKRHYSLGKVISIDPLTKRVQLDASVDSGYSGGAILNDQGELIGIIQVSAGRSIGMFSQELDQAEGYFPSLRFNSSR